MSKRFQRQLKQLGQEGFTVQKVSDTEYVLRKDQQQFRVKMPADYPFRAPKIQKRKGQERFVYAPPQWSPAITLKEAFADVVSPRERLLEGGQRARFQHLGFASPFVSMSLLKPVSSYPDESFDFLLVPHMMNSLSLREMLREKHVRLLTFGHKGIAVGVLEPAFRVLCDTFGITVERGHELLLSDFFRLSPRDKMFVELCFADAFKRGNHENIEALRRMTDRYIDALRREGLLTTAGYDYARIHNESLVFARPPAENAIVSQERQSRIKRKTPQQSAQEPLPKKKKPV